MLRGQRVPALLITLLTLMGLSSAVFAHGGEDHSEEKQTPVAFLGQMNARLVKTDNLEILVKYSNPKFGEETLLRVFITDLKTNAPVPGVKVAMALNSVDKPETAAIEIVAAPTSTPGIYEARVAFHDPGQYNLWIWLAGQNISEQITVSGIVVPANSADGVQTDKTRVTIMLFALMVFLISAMAAGYYFWLRPRRSEQVDAEAEHAA